MMRITPVQESVYLPREETVNTEIKNTGILLELDPSNLSTNKGQQNLYLSQNHETEVL